MPWTTHASRIVYANRWIEVREDQVTRPDGEKGIYGVVTMRNPAVFVVALTEADEVVMVEVDRHTTGPSLEIPAGGTDGQDPLVAARRELLEETGLTARDWSRIGAMTALNGVCRAPEVVFLARGLSPAPGAELAAEGITAVRRVPWRQALDHVRDGTITDGETVASLLYAALALDRL